MKSILFFVLSAFLCVSAKTADVKEISIPESLQENFETFEPSAAIYLEDLDRYLVASDDTDEDDQPYLFLMDSQGNLEETPLLAKGLEKMTDIESMTLGEDGFLYLLSSQGLNKNGKEKPERNILAKASRVGHKIKIEGYTALRPKLLKALETSSHPTLKKMAEIYYDELDIEASFVTGGRLFVGLKNPQPKKGKALILDLGTPDEILSGKKLNPSIWNTIDFGAVTHEATLLSDMIKIDSDYYLTTTLEDKSEGQLWRFSPEMDTLVLLESFGEVKPEALAMHSNGNELMIFFDEGEDTALFTEHQLKSLTR